MQESREMKNILHNFSVIFLMLSYIVSVCNFHRKSSILQRVYIAGQEDFQKHDWKLLSEVILIAVFESKI